MFDETVILKKFAESPPDFIAVVHKDTSEYGYRFFGKDYGRDIYSWIFRNYTPFRLIGAPPLQSDYFGIALLQKKAEG
jgi:hypothetical protein